ncbi:MAG: hypothetical protein AAF517_13430, partial [Planctomycetota bacterium]
FFSLLNIGKRDPRIVPVLVEALHDPDLRQTALDSLTALGAKAKAAVPALEKLLGGAELATDSSLADWEWRKHVAHALRAIRGATKVAARSSQ